MQVLTYPHSDPGSSHQRLFVFLRGIGGDHQCFEEEGLVEDVWHRGLPYDMAAPNAHVGYYMDRSLIVRLKADVIDPARARGVEKIWLVGVSMGGLGAMLYLYDHPEDIAGVYLIAPFLGPPYLLEEIEASGGLRAWRPGIDDAKEDWQRTLWHWIQQTIADRPDKMVYLGYGLDDPYRTASQLLAQVLPPERVYVIDGGHDSATFRTLWQKFLVNDAILRN
jgi:pimeloyl-ACP methyl ester carboxylesterase